MNTYFEPSISAYMLMNQVYKNLELDEVPAQSVQNGNISKIMQECIKIIETRYDEKRTRELLKYYIAHSFFEDYDLESDFIYSTETIN